MSEESGNRRLRCALGSARGADHGCDDARRVPIEPAREHRTARDALDGLSWRCDPLTLSPDPVDDPENVAPPHEIRDRRRLDGVESERATVTRRERFEQRPSLGLAASNGRDVYRRCEVRGAYVR